MTLGPLGPVSPYTGRDLDDPLDALLPADREWLDRMADVLPPHLPVNGTSRFEDAFAAALIAGLVDPRIMGDSCRG